MTVKTECCKLLLWQARVAREGPQPPRPAGIKRPSSTQLSFVDSVLSAVGNSATHATHQGTRMTGCEVFVYKLFPSECVSESESYFKSWGYLIQHALVTVDTHCFQQHVSFVFTTRLQSSWVNGKIG